MKKSVLLFVAMFCIATLNVNAQNNPPVAVNDSIIIIKNFPFDTIVHYNILLNDFDPDGDAIKIAEVFQQGEGEYFNFTDSTLTCTISGLLEIVFKYRVCETADTNSLSNWAYLNINPGMDENAPIAKNDTIICSPGYPVNVNVLLNDYSPIGNSFYLESSNMISDSIIEIFVDFNDYQILHNEYKLNIYFIRDTISSPNTYDVATIYTKIENNNFYDSLNINNVNARFYCFGHHFWELAGGQGAKYFVPNGSTKTSIFANTFWIGGLDENDNLHLAGERYRQVGADYWHGPISNIYDSDYDKRWFNMWKLTKQEIEYHKTHWSETGYTPIENISTWPGNGYEFFGQQKQIAPFYDRNNDEIYEPMLGEYPVIKGDQALFFVFNDVRDYHSETQGLPMGIEIRGMAYAFDTPDDSALWSTTFLHYEILNLSDTTYHDTYMGVFTDTDLGYSWDDYVQCDVQRGFYFTYNGREIDGNGELNAYGEHPPAQGVLFLGGPFMDDDGIDNPKYDINNQQICDESINGLNFGDAIIDNERLGMTSFLYYTNCNSGISCDPQIASEYYNFMKAKWKDNSSVFYGGNGVIAYGALGPECKFMLPNDSDTCNWGTNGILPFGGFNQNGLYWTEEIVGNNPNDRRGLGSSGPFTFKPGDVQQIDIAFVWARDYNGTPWSSVELLKEYCSYIKDKFENNNFFTDISNSLITDNKILLYPNPVADFFYIKLSHKITKGTYTVYNVIGENVISGSISGKSSFRVNTVNLTKGLFIIKINDGKNIYIAKFIKK